jgi:protein O-GlcNAc transferase
MQTDHSEQLNAARVLCAQHQYGAAGAILANLLLSSPADFDALLLVAQLHLHTRNYDRAFAAASMAAELNPNDPNALYMLGRAQKVRGDLDGAESSYRRAIEASPFDPNTLTSLGVLLRGKGALDEAVALYQRALAVAPDHPEANNNLANALAAAGAGNQAVALHERSRTALSAELERMRVSAASLIQQGNLRDAFAVLKAALRIAPKAADLWLRAGELAIELGMPAESLPYLNEAARLDPTSYQSMELARRVCFIGGLHEQTMHYSRLSYALNPSEEILVARKLFLPAIQPSVEAIHSVRGLYQQGLDEVMAADCRPSLLPDGLQPAAFYLAYHGESNRDLQTKAAQMYLKRNPGLAMTAPHCAALSRRPGKIRVGFISKFLSAHSIGKTTRGLIEKLGRDRFEVYAMRITPSADDEMTRLICASADHEVVVDPDLARAREQIASLGLDILFYQDIGMEPKSYFLAFARLAPVQCVSFGHPDTTGVPNMDYFISNDLYETPESPSHYSERLFLLHDLPTLAYYYRPTRGIVLNRKDFGLPANATLYLCPQTLFKLHPDFDPLIRGILQRDPSGVVVFIHGRFEQWGELLRLRFAQTMPDVAARVTFIPAMELKVFLELLAVADVILDPIHFNGMNSSLESFAVGAPVVTLPTKLQRGRHTQAMYRKMGILDCTASSGAEYIEMAVRLGTDPSFARGVRERILTHNAVLFENPQVVREFERFFVEATRERFGSTAIPAATQTATLTPTPSS